jgi:hypothetical protein
MSARVSIVIEVRCWPFSWIRPCRRIDAIGGLADASATPARRRFAARAAAAGGVRGIREHGFADA